MPSGRKTTADAAKKARAARKAAVAAQPLPVKLNQQHQQAAGLTSEVRSSEPDRILVYGPRGPPKYLNKRDTLERIGGWTYQTVWQWMRAGKFPRSFLIGGRVFWLESEVLDWMETQLRQRLKGDEAAFYSRD
jgi:predicted DNA-binding transcriptional regulator AlpA